MSKPSRMSCATFFGGSLLALCALPAHALVSLNDGADKFFVSASAATEYDTNYYANTYGIAETVMTGTVTGEYSRRAGEIGVEASAGVHAIFLQEHVEENARNPFVKAELTKTGGRVSGSLSLKAERTSDNDAAANIRTVAWNYDAQLNVKYPIIERYFLTAGAGYSRNDYEVSKPLYDLDTASARMDLNYSLDSQRDLLVGYRYREENSQGPSDYNDNDFSVGLRGRILPKLTGTVRAGYQFRSEEGNQRRNYDGFSASASANWLPTKQNSVNGLVLRDYRTTSTDFATEVTAASLLYTRVLNAEWTAGCGAQAGQTKYLGASKGKNREDTYTGWNANIAWSANEHLRVAFNYSFYHNSSSLAFADYSRHVFALSVSSRW